MNSEPHANHDEQRLRERAASEGLALRPAVDADAPGISALIHSLSHYRSPTPVGPAPPEFLAGFAPETIRAYIASSRYRYWVALLDGQLAGVLGIREAQSILHLFVADSCQRRGIASALWGRARSELLAAAGEINLVVKSSIYAIPVYERFGFKVTGPRVEGAGVTYVPMQLVISRGQC